MDKLFKIPSYEDFKQAADDVICNLYSMGKQSSNILEDDIKLAKEDLRKLILENSCDFSAVVSSLESRQYNQDKVSYFATNLLNRKSDLLLLTLLHFNSAYGETVQDFDWCIKLVMGTSELKSLKYPLLQMMLFTITKSGSGDKKIYDVSKEMVDKMILTLEQAVSS